MQKLTKKIADKAANKKGMTKAPATKAGASFQIFLGGWQLPPFQIHSVTHKKNSRKKKISSDNDEFFL